MCAVPEDNRDKYFKREKEINSAKCYWEVKYAWDLKSSIIFIKVEGIGGPCRTVRVEQGRWALDWSICIREQKVGK